MLIKHLHIVTSLFFHNLQVNTAFHCQRSILAIRGLTDEGGLHSIGGFPMDTQAVFFQALKNFNLHVSFQIGTTEEANSFNIRNH